MVYNSIIEDYLTQSQGLLVREKLWLSQVLCGACEKQVQFKVAQYDANVSDAATDEEFTSRPAQFMVKEQSECCQRYCFHQARHLKLGIFPMGGTMHSTGEQVRPTIFEAEWYCEGGGRRGGGTAWIILEVAFTHPRLFVFSSFNTQ